MFAFSRKILQANKCQDLLSRTDERHLRIPERAKRQRLGNPLIDPQLGNELEDVDELEDLERVFGGEGGGGGRTTFSRMVVGVESLSNLRKNVIMYCAFF